MDLERALRISAAGMAAQSTRLRVVAENLANRDSTGETPGADPFRRKTVTFGAKLDRALAAETVEVRRIGTAAGDFPRSARSRSTRPPMPAAMSSARMSTAWSR